MHSRLVQKGTDVYIRHNLRIKQYICKTFNSVTIFTHSPFAFDGLLHK